ncbi:MAG TPA: uroporphyrinogen decarboxylase family protein, partial [Anaerolineales bacterium]|nr:uroporphyrinogen decarboxylase family protein [Anaerolineales bacterium]
PDRPPVALWRHFPGDDQHPQRLAEAHIRFQRQYDFDLVKVTPESTYMTKEWGGTDAWRGATEGTRDYVERGVHAVDDWPRLRVLDPTAGRLGDQVKALRAIVSAVGPHTPVIQTIFSPLTQARKLAGEAVLLSHLRQHPDAVAAALETITQTTLDFLAEIKKTGIAGIFYALQFAQYALLSDDEFDRFCMPYHRRILEAASDLWLNVLHLHGTGVRFDRAAELPVQVMNWHDLETAPSLAEGQARFSGIVCGGLRQWEAMAYGTPEDVREEAAAALEATGGVRFLLGTGCVTPIVTPHGNLAAVRASVEGD